MCTRLLKGKAETVTAGPEFEVLMKFVIKRNNPHFHEESVAKHAAQMARKCILAVVQPDKLSRWDHRKLSARQ